MDKSVTLPAISVVMSVYNGEKFLKQAIESILGQTYKNFEFLIIDDGSNDKSNKIIRSYKDTRIRLLEQENKGLVASLNRGILEAKGALIARQDADDASLPDRLAMQIKYFDENPRLVIVGSSMKVMNDSGSTTHEHYVLLDDPELREELLVRSPFAHGSVMFKRDPAIKAGLYDKNFWPAEDYEFWLRLSAYGEFANINEPKYIYRENLRGISSLNQEKQLHKTDEIMSIAWSKRSSLIGRKPVSFSSYAGLKDERVRTDRIMKNVEYAVKTAIKKRNLVLALKASKLLRKEPLAYRRLLGKIKRRVTTS